MKNWIMKTKAECQIEIEYYIEVKTKEVAEEVKNL
jgi:hypothetical protein